MRALSASLLLVVALARAAAAAPRLVVVVSVDQMRADYLDRPGYSAGLKRLRQGGAVFTEAHQLHIPTETGPGHAAIMTGRYPGTHGIVANEWYDRRLLRDVYCVEDSVFGIGPEHLEGYTLGDALKAAHPGSRVFSFSLKDRAAVLMGGKKADEAVWYEPKTGAFTTSAYYAKPGWLDGFNERLKAQGGLLEGVTDYPEVMFRPEGDELLLSLAQTALERERIGRDGPDILALSFSVTDKIGHRYGPESPQMAANLRRLDATLGRLLDALDRGVGKGNYDLALTADHGVMPVKGSKRVLWTELDARLESALEKRWPMQGGRWIVSNDYPELYLNRAAAAQKGLDWPVFVRDAARVLSGVPDVAAVYVSGELPSIAPFIDAYRRSEFIGRSGDLVVRVSSGVLVAENATGSDHGTPYEDDSHVPLVLYGPDFAPGAIARPVPVAALAPTLGRALGLLFHPEPGVAELDAAFARKP